jgi:hypothetical protein
MFQKLSISVFLFVSIASSPARAQGIVTCVSGQSGVINCPCSNQPVGNAGCNNSLNTGGAALTATGVNSLSNDSVQLNCTGIGTSGVNCNGSNMNIVSVLYEGASPFPTGTNFGDGVLCCGGPIYLLNVQLASAGVYHFPLPGTSGLHQAAIAAGDPLLANQTRWYFVAYRDSCPSFCTPSLRQKSNSYQITWQP